MSELKKGVYVDKPHANAPSFIKANFNINVDEFTAFLNANRNEKGFVRFQLKEGKDGKSLYLDLNEFKPISNDAP